MKVELKFDTDRIDFSFKWLPSNLPASVILGTSGTTGKAPKLYCFAKETLLAHAESLCKHYQLDSKDKFFNPLGENFIGGLMVKYRAEITGADYIRPKSKDKVLEEIIQSQATVTSLVPYQLENILKQKANAPESLKIVFIGGGSLREDLYQQARSKGWPLVLCYGQTQTCSQVATVISKNTDHFTLYPWNQASFTDNHELLIKTPYHFDFQIETLTGDCLPYSQFVDQHGFFNTEDLATPIKKGFTILGRKGQDIKLPNGLNSTLNELERYYRTHHSEAFPQESLFIKGSDQKTVCLVSPHQIDESKLLDSLKKNQIKIVRKEILYTDSGKPILDPMRYHL